mgnify:CR=1 FL=1
MKVVLWFLMMFMPLMANASSVNEEQLFHRLDSYIAQRSKFTQRKEAKLLRLKKQLYMTSDKRSQLSLYNQIYREYYTYRYDSAMTYAKKGYQLAAQLQDDYFINLNKINRAAVLSTGGFYSQAEDLMLAIDVEKMSPKLLQYYYYTLTWVYNYWQTFCNKSEFQEGLVAKKRFYLGKTLAHIGNKESALYYYLSGEFEYLKQRTSKKMLQLYMKALSASPLNSRVHASSAYCIARYYYDTDQKDLYEKYIVEAAISDQICPLKENLALQEFSKRLNDSIDAPGSCFIHRISIRSYTVRQHITTFLIHVVAPSIDPVPASGHSSARSEEIPLFSVFQPALQHPSLTSIADFLEIIPASILFIEKPPGIHPAVICKMEPRSLFLLLFGVRIVDPCPLIGIHSSAGNKLPASILLFSPLPGDTAFRLFPYILRLFQYTSCASASRRMSAGTAGPGLIHQLEL